MYIYFHFINEEVKPQWGEVVSLKWHEKSWESSSLSLSLSLYGQVSEVIYIYVCERGRESFCEPFPS